MLEELLDLHQQLDQGNAAAAFRREGGLVIFQDRYFICADSKLKSLLLREFHNTPNAGHGGVKKMLVGSSALFYWKGMRKSVEEYIKNCLVCQQTKYSKHASGGYLQPLPTPTTVWEDVSMDFITGMPLSNGFTVILVVVDRFSKYAHFAALPTSFNAHQVAKVFMDTVVKHHGIPKTIMSDRDPIFFGKFWTQLFKLSGTQLNHSTAYHPQTDGQIEVAEYYYNTSYHSSIKMTPYQALYGKVPLSIIPYPPGSSKVATVDDVLVERDGLLRQLRHNLLAAKNQMEEKANLKRREIEFSVGDIVLVKLHPYHHLTLDKRNGSDEVSELPEVVEEGLPVEQPLAICGSRLVLKNGRTVKQYLAAYPAYDLGDKVVSEGERNDTHGANKPGRTKRVSKASLWHKDFVMD
ncbi:ty3-gypsy retrotransposon protein [Tanacetum coccineum]